MAQRYFSFLLLVFLLGSTARAQTPADSTAGRAPASTAPRPGYVPSAAPSPSLSPAAASAADDTVYALRKFYARRRTGGALWIVASGLGLVRVLTAANTTTTYGNGAYTRTSEANGEAVAVGLGLMAAFDAYGIAKIARYGPRKEAALAADVRAGRPLPAVVRRRLRRHIFRR